MVPSADKEAFRKLLASSMNIMILSGAGLSASSGIPTYRGSSNSLWVQNSISFGTSEKFRNNPSASWNFYHPRRLICLNAKPNDAHRALAILNNPSTLSRIAPLAKQPPLHITQNIDELSLRVLGTLPQAVQDIAKEHIIQIHGSILRTRCTSCRHVLHSHDPFLALALKDLQADNGLQDIPVEKLPKCGGDLWAGSNRYGRCGGLLRPDVIWFGEVPPQLGEVARKITWCDLLVVVGTSTLVKPAAEFPSQVKHHGGKVAIFNTSRSENDQGADFLFLGGCEETLADVLGVKEDIANFWTSAVRWHPPSYDIRVEDVPMPQVQEPDDAVVKVKLAALCGSDLHVYRGNGGVDKIHTCGHEFIGEVVALGSAFGTYAMDRTMLYSALKVGDKVVSPFTINCGECWACRLGCTARCTHSALFGSPALEGGQAQYVRVPKAGATLFNLSDPKTWPNSTLTDLADSSLLMLADILPTGVFAALQCLSHPKVQPVLTGKPWPLSLHPDSVITYTTPLFQEDTRLTVVIIGLGPVGICTVVSLLDMLATRSQSYRIIAVDLLESRREKMRAVYATIDQEGKGLGEFITCCPEEATTKVGEWTQGVGCDAAIEVVGHNSALTLAYKLVRAFGVITSVGVHGEPQLPFTGGQMYNKNISFDFGRCPARAMFPMAFEILVKRQDVFGKVGEKASLVDKITDFGQAAESYRAFDKGEVGKIIFDPWK